MSDKSTKHNPSESSPFDSVDATVRLDDSSNLREEVLSTVRSARLPYLFVMSGNELGLRRRLIGSVLVGRDPEAGVVLTDLGVSYRHARLEDRGDSWSVVDLGSTNGTRVNGEVVKDKALSPGDRVAFGATLTRFEIQEAADQTYDEVVERLINKDELTGLYVKRKFDQELRVYIAAAKRKSESVGLLVMDLDGVKQINDTHGHLFGAYVIGRSGKIIGEVVGKRGFASRFGGDEYVAAIPGVDCATAVDIAREIHAAIGAASFVHQGKVLEPGISIGVAAFPEHARTAEKLFECADQAMYEAKRGGKNRVCEFRGLGG